MRMSARIAALAIFLWVGAILLWQLEKQAHLASGSDPSKVVMLFAGLLLVGTAAAVLLAGLVLPAFGEWTGSFLFSPQQKIEAGPHDAAIALLAQGDPQGALKEYGRVVAHDPDDSHAWSEMARICCRDLGDPQQAAAVLGRALERDWPQEQASFLANRLADVYVQEGDIATAQSLLQQVVETMPGTSFAAHATRRLRELGHLPAGGKNALTDQAG